MARFIEQAAAAAKRAPRVASITNECRYGRL